jgi:biotin carboxyl carrier protein
MPGTVVAVRAAVGQHVRKGETLVALEAMKMEHAIRSPHDGEVTEVCVTVGSQVETDQVLVVVAEAASANDGRRGDEA